MTTRSGEEIRAALVKFVARWQTYAGTERSEAQAFLNELFECYVNGDLFAKSALVHLTQDEAAELLTIAEYNWRAVDPTIFGSLIEGFLGTETRSTLGAHYT